MNKGFDTCFAIVSILFFRNIVGRDLLRESFELPPEPMALSIELVK